MSATQYTKPIDILSHNPSHCQPGQWVIADGRKLQFVRRTLEGTLWLHDKGEPVNIYPSKALSFEPKSNNRRKPSKLASFLKIFLNY